MNILKNTNKLRVLYLLIILISVIYYILFFYASVNIISKNFAGFCIEAPLFYSDQISLPHWNTRNNNLKMLDKFEYIDGIKFKNIKEVDNYIKNKKEGEYIEYSVKKNSEYIKIKEKVIKFTLYDWFKLFLPFNIIFVILISLSIFTAIKSNLNKKSRIFIEFNISFCLSFISFINSSLIHFTYSIDLGYLFMYSLLRTLNLFSNNKIINYISNTFNIFLLISFGFINNYLNILFNIDILKFDYLFEYYLYIFNLNSLLIAIILLFVILAFTYLFFYEKDNSKHSQLKIVVFGIYISIISILIIWSIPLILDKELFIPLNSLVILFISFLPLSLGYSIYKNKNIIILNSLVKQNGLLKVINSILFIILIYLYFSIIEIIQYTLKIDGKFLIFIISIASFVLSITVSIYLQKIIEKIFYKEKIYINNRIEEFINNSLEIVNYSQLTDELFKVLEDCFNPSSIAFYEVIDKEIILLFEKNANTKDLVLTNTESFFTDKKIISKILLKNEVKAYIILGEKKSSLIYTEQDKKFLEQINNSLSLTLNNVQYNENKLKEETIERIFNVKKNLIEELIVNLSYDLKSPLYSCLTILDNLDKNLQTKNDLDKKFINQYLTEIHNELSRLSNHIQVSLDSELYELNRLDLKLENINISEYCDKAYFNNHEHSRANDIKVNRNYISNQIYFNLDKIKFERALNNILYKSIIMAKETVSINILNNDNSFIIVFLNDGDLLPDDKKYLLFEKYTSKLNTGLGLYLSKKYIELMNGYIKFNNDDLINKFIIEFSITT